MSLVNDMLRDLDKRRQQTPLANQQEAMTPAPSQQQPAAQTRWLRLAVLTAVVLTVVAGSWLYDNPQLWKPLFKPAANTPKQLAKPVATVPKPEQEAEAKLEPTQLLEAQWTPEQSGWRLQLTLSQPPGQRTEVSTSNRLQLQLGAIDKVRSLPPLPVEWIRQARLIKGDQQLALELETSRKAAFDVVGRAEQQGQYRLDVVVTPQLPAVVETKVQAVAPVVSAPVAATRSRPVPPSRGNEAGQKSAEPAVIATAPLRKSRAQTPAQLDQSTRLKAQKLLTKRQQQQAQALLESFVGEQPEAPRSRALLAVLLIGQDQQQRAADLIDQGLALAPLDAGLRKLKARLLIDAGQLPAASSLLATNPPAPEQDSEYHQILAAALQADNQHQQAAQVYHGLLRSRADQPAWWIGLARSLEALEQPQQARQAYQNVLKIPQLRPALADYARQRLAQLGG